MTLDLDGLKPGIGKSSSPGLQGIRGRLKGLPCLLFVAICRNKKLFAIEATIYGEPLT